MEDSTPKNPNGLMKDGNKSPSSSTAPKKISPKDRKHRRDKNECVDVLVTYFQIVTALELPKEKRNWSVVTQLVWSQIFKAWKLEKQQKALIKLEEHAEKTKQILGSVREVVEKANIKLNGLKSLDQQFLTERPEVDSSVIKGHDLEVGELRASVHMLHYELAVLKHGINAEVQRLIHLVNMEFSMPFLQQPDPNSNPNQIHQFSKKQGHTALKIFFYMYTGYALPTVWKEAEVKVKAKIDEAIEIGKKLKDISRPPEDVAKLEQTVVESTLAAFEDAKRQVDDCKCLLQHGVGSEVVVRDMDTQALGLDCPLLAGYTQNGQRAMIYNLEVPWDLQNPPEPSDFAQMLVPLTSLEATGYSSETNCQVAPRADGDIECWLMEISEQFPKVKEGGLLEELLEIAKGIPQIGLESMDPHGSKLKQKVDNTYPEVGSLPQNKRKLNQPKKLPLKKKGKRPD